MQEETKNFLDSYALIELIEGNPEYKKFAEQPIYTSSVNLVELAYHFAQKYPAGKLTKMVFLLNPQMIEIKPEQITKIALFRKENASKKFSYIDCIGYILARENRMVFITGDKAFKNMPNVGFVQ